MSKDTKILQGQKKGANRHILPSSGQKVNMGTLNNQAQGANSKNAPNGKSVNVLYRNAFKGYLCWVIHYSGDQRPFFIMPSIHKV